MSPDRLIFGGQSAALSTRTIITTQRPQTPHQFLELSEEPGNVIHTRFWGGGGFGLGLMGASHKIPNTHQEIIVGEQQQISERVFLQLVPKFRDDGLIVEWIDRLRLLLLQRHALRQPISKKPFSPIN